MQSKRGQIAQIVRQMAAAQNPGVHFPRLSLGYGLGYIKKEVVDDE
jgi:hypothetical protein